MKISLKKMKFWREKHLVDTCFFLDDFLSLASFQFTSPFDSFVSGVYRQILNVFKSPIYMRVLQRNVVTVGA